jgi:hypothetical protein
MTTLSAAGHVTRAEYVDFTAGESKHGMRERFRHA